ncbi:hypothetical protein ANRL4_03841 [Anaerolineae bacterium]|nr:hypothetical protein ANRL4_03841 [Anaerolineae bacterium]
MSDSPKPTLQDPAEEKSSGGMTRWFVIAFGALGIFVIVGLLIAIIGGVADSAGVANFFRILRDFFLIVLALQGVLICLALVILVVQLAALINLLSTEVKPILDEARETLSTARGTTEFVTRKVAAPVIRTTSTVAGAVAFMREITNIRRLVRGKK